MYKKRRTYRIFAVGIKDNTTKINPEEFGLILKK